MNPEIKEIFEFLEKRDDYAIWAGYAQFGHLGINPSPDVDIYTTSETVMHEISLAFEQNGWKVTHQPIPISEKWDKLEKNGTTFDVIFSRPASKLFLGDKVKLKIEGHELWCISKEVLFLTKIGALTSRGRNKSKQERDLTAILALRKLIDIPKVRKLVSKLPDSYWQIGWV